MKSKTVGIALGAIVALSVVVPGAATAELAQEKPGNWSKNGVVLAAGASEPITCSIGEHPEGEFKFVLESKLVGNTPVKLTATGASCPGWKIFNEGGFAKATGKIRFTGVTIDEPAGCKVPAALETVALKSQIWMEEGSAVEAFQRFVPAAGATFVTIPVTECATEGNYNLKGVLFGRYLGGTGAEALSHEATFSQVINDTAGGGLTLGANEADLTGDLAMTLTNGGNWKVE